jgi:pimeloyl-ACP methyl ester carboxylesterase
VDELVTEAASLRSLDRVEKVGLIAAATSLGDSQAGEAERYDLAFFFVLRDFTALEPFGTNPRYIRFLQGKAAPLLRAFAGADIALAAPFPPLQSGGACLALAAPYQTYDWEVREALERWSSAAPADSYAFGLAIGERQRYRGCGFRFAAGSGEAPPLPDRRFQAALVSGEARLLS